MEFEPYPADTWTGWDACHVPANFQRDCTLQGGGHYPIKLTVEKEILWEKEIAACTTEYRKTEYVSVNPDTETLPDMLGVLNVTEGAEPQGG